MNEILEWNKDRRRYVDEIIEEAESGDSSSKCCLAMLLIGNFSEEYRGIGPGPDFDRAFKIVNESVSEGYVRGKYELSMFHEEGWGTKKDLNKAFDLLFEAVNYDFENNNLDPSNAIKLGGFYEAGKGTEQSYKEAFKWYKIASEGNYNPEGGKAKIAEFYLEGKGIEKNSEKAFILFQDVYEKISRNNFQKKLKNRVMNRIGRMYLKGDGTDMDKLKAYNYFWAAAKEGCVDSQNDLDLLCKESPWVLSNK
jgi:hypothetical protein